MVVEQAAIPGDHMEQKENALTLPELAAQELFCLRMYRENLPVSLHIGLTVVAQTVVVMRQRHMTRSVLLHMLDGGGAAGRCGPGWQAVRFAPW